MADGPTIDIVRLADLTNDELTHLYGVWKRTGDLQNKDADLWDEVNWIIASRVAAARADERRKAWEWFRDLLDAHMLEGQPVYDEFMADRAAIQEAVVLDRPYEVSNQQDTDLDVDLANRLYDEVLQARDEGEAQRR